MAIMFHQFDLNGKKYNFDVFDYDYKKKKVGTYEGWLPNILIVLKKETDKEYVIIAIDYIEDLELHLSITPIYTELVNAAKIMLLQHPPVSDEKMDEFIAFLKKLSNDLSKSFLDTMILASDLK